MLNDVLAALTRVKIGAVSESKATDTFESRGITLVMFDGNGAPFAAATFAPALGGEDQKQTAEYASAEFLAASGLGDDAKELAS